MYINNISQKAASFIQHKRFHPGNYKEMEKVWIAEEKAAAAERKEKELQTQKLQEKRLEELRRQHGHVTSNPALQWVTANQEYARVFMDKQANKEEKEEKRVEPEYVFQEQNKYGRVDEAEMERRLREDPLMLIKRVEAQKEKRAETHDIERLKKQIQARKGQDDIDNKNKTDDNNKKQNDFPLRKESLENEERNIELPKKRRLSQNQDKEYRSNNRRKEEQEVNCKNSRYEKRNYNSKRNRNNDYRDTSISHRRRYRYDDSNVIERGEPDYYYKDGERRYRDEDCFGGIDANHNRKFYNEDINDTNSEDNRNNIASEKNNEQIRKNSVSEISRNGSVGVNQSESSSSDVEGRLREMQAAGSELQRMREKQIEKMRDIELKEEISVRETEIAPKFIRELAAKSLEVYNRTEALHNRRLDKAIIEEAEYYN